MQDWILSGSTDVGDKTEIVAESAGRIRQLRESISSAIKGKEDAIELALIALLGGGHLLIEDVPGIGKTTLANALARSIDLSFQRIQFTSDLLPSDVIGISVYNQRDGVFEWKPGPIFANIVLADEINRATPKTQSALLEAMAEEQVTFEGVSRALVKPFMVIATQNPSEHHGTYPLPESQLDRFILRLSMGYPDAEDEKQILSRDGSVNPLALIAPKMNSGELIELQRLTSAVLVNETILDYILTIVNKTRNSDAIELGISPRGSLALLNSAKARAIIDGRDFCLPDDVKSLVIPCFAHRIAVRPTSSSLRRSSRESEEILNEILDETEAPV